MRGFAGSGKADGSSGPDGPQGRSRRPRRRDRHGRGLRGSLAPASVPLTRNRAERFDEFVLDAVEQVERAVAADATLTEQLGVVEFAVEEVPPEVGLAAAETGSEPLAMARSEPASLTAPPRVVVYRRPVELRTPDLRDRAELVRELVVDELAELLGVPSERLDPPGD